MEQALRKLKEAAEIREAKQRAFEESIRKAEQRIQGMTPTHFVVDEFSDFNVPVPARKPTRKKSKSGSDHEPYYVKFTNKKRR